MSKEITKARILQELSDKFKLRELAPEVFSFSEQVIPTYDIERHVEHNDVSYHSVSVTSGPTGFLLYTVPPTQRFQLRGYNVVFMAAGAYTVTGVYICRGDCAYNNIYLDMTLGQSASYAVNLPQLVTLDPGDTLNVYIDSYTSTADIRLYLDRAVEELR